MAWTTTSGGMPVWQEQTTEEANLAPSVPNYDEYPSNWITQVPEGSTMTQREYQATLKAEEYAAATEADRTQTGLDRAATAADAQTASTAATDALAARDLTVGYRDTALGARDAAILARDTTLGYRDTTLTYRDQAAQSAEDAAASAASAATFDPANFYDKTASDARFSPIIHTHLWADITDKPATYTPTAHAHLWADITDKPATFTPSAHGHAISEVTDLINTLAAKVNLSGDAVIVTETLSPDTPPAGKVLVYAKADGKIYKMDDTGAEKSVGGGPSLGDDSVIRTNAKVITTDIAFTGNENGMSAGPIEIASGVTVDIPAGSTWSIV